MKSTVNLFAIGWLLHLRSAVPTFQLSGSVGKVIGLSFVWFVAIPILLGWIVATLLSRNERNA